MLSYGSLKRVKWKVMNLLVLVKKWKEKEKGNHFNILDYPMEFWVWKMHKGGRVKLKDEWIIKITQRLRKRKGSLWFSKQEFSSPLLVY